MATLTQTLSDYLRGKNPNLYMKSSTRGSNTTSSRPPYLIPGSIEKWEDFGYDSLQEIYGGALHRVLTRQFSCRDYSDIPQKPYREIANENCLEMLLAMWNWRVISEGLSKAQECLYGRDNTKVIYMAKGGRSRFAMGGKFYPDWAGIQSDPQDDLDPTEIRKPPNILPGDSKLGRKWSSNKIEDGLVDPAHQNSDWMKPLRQIFTYCVRANARYGYIITGEEVVVIRVRPILEPGDPGETNDDQESRHESESSKIGQETVDSQASLPDLDEGHDFILSSPVFGKVEANGRLEYKAVPWSNAASLDPRRSADLTVNLALWWLHIMASVSSNIKEEYAPLKEVAKPSCFGVVHSSFPLPETSENMRPNLPFRSRKRGSSAVSDKGTPPDDSEDKDPVEYRRSNRNMKRVRTDDEDTQPRRQTRSMKSQN
ncbi:hypothetical protein JMJ35_005560 [Cladonia borealis]|uniref:Uncharacterized protein n=1 Tax=Cladonia borealis TaxID=184061 RepID=A0AA39R021_9LECA|nr:hypothetical protein JMJ35_005560 [Cladonia borealis]